MIQNRVINKLGTEMCERSARNCLLKSGRKGSDTDIRRLVRPDAYEIAFDEKESR